MRYVTSHTRNIPSTDDISQRHGLQVRPRSRFGGGYDGRVSENGRFFRCEIGWKDDLTSHHTILISSDNARPEFPTPILSNLVVSTSLRFSLSANIAVTPVSLIASTSSLS